MNCTREFFAKRLRQLALELDLVLPRDGRKVADSRCADSWFRELCRDDGISADELEMSRIDEALRLVCMAGYARHRIDPLVATFLRLALQYGSRKVTWLKEP